LVATLDHRGFGEVSAVTFGQPKFTAAHGAAKLSHLKILRLVHDEDPPPMVEGCLTALKLAMESAGKKEVGGN